MSRDLRGAAGSWAARLAALSFAVVIVTSPFAARFDLLARPARQVAPAYTDVLLPWAYVAMVVTLGLWALSVGLRPRPVRFGPAFIWIPAVGLLAVSALGAAVSIDPKLAAFNVAKLAVTIAIGWYVVNEVDDLERLIVPVLLMVGSQAVIAIIQGVTQHAVGLTVLQEVRVDAPGASIVATAEGTRWIRAYGLTAHPNILGGVLAFGLLVIAAAQGTRRSTRLARMTVFGLGVAALFLTFSRGAWIAFAIGLVVAIAMLAIRRDRAAVRSWLAAAVTALVIGVALAVPFSSYLAARATISGPVATEERSIDERLALSDLALRVFADHPLLGTGLGTLPKALKAIEPAFTFSYQPAHIVVIDAAAETGIVGGLFYVTLVIAPWLALARARHRWTRSLAAASAGVAAVTVVGLFDFYTWTAAAGRTWAWILLGLWVVAYRLATDGRDGAPPNPIPGPVADEPGGRRLRVAFVVPGFVVDRDEPGLPAVVDLVERIARRHDCQVIALRHPPARPAYRVAGATVTALGAGHAAGPLGRAAVLANGVRAVLRLHRRRPLDLVHGLWADEAGAVATIAGRLVRRPVVVSVLGGELARIPDIGYGAALGLGGRWTVAVSFRGADLVTAGSSTILAAVAERRPASPIALLPLGVDTTVFRPAEPAPGDRPGLPEESATQTILFAGSLEPVKDPAALLRVFGRLAADRPDLRLELVGDGRLRTGLEAIVSGTTLAGRIRFAAHVDRNEMPDRYRAASVLAITSRHEGQSMVAVEAAASGLPVVGTRVGVLPDLGEAASSVPVGDETALAGALAAVLDDPVRAARMAAAGRATALARFDLERTTADLLERYDELVTRGGAPAARR